MPVSYARERKRFDREQKLLEKEYLFAGMSQDQIIAMKEFDLGQFNRDMAFRYRVQPIDPTEDLDANDTSPLLEKFRESMATEDVVAVNVVSWLDEIAVEPIASEIEKLSFDSKFLLTLLFKYGYSQLEICEKYGISTSAFSRRYERILEALRTNSVSNLRDYIWFSNKGVKN